MSMDELLGCEIQEVTKDSWDSVESEIMEIEKEFREKIRDSSDYLKSMLDFEGALFLVLKKGNKIIGYLAGARLEAFEKLLGVKEDVHFGLHDTFYLESIAILKQYQGKGLGSHLLGHLFLKIKKMGISYVTGHFAENYGEKWGGIHQMTFTEWYGNRHKYCRIHLGSASWIESCKTMITIESILAGFSAVVFAVLFSISLSYNVFWAIFPIASSIWLFVYAAEKSTDAIDERIPLTYIKTLMPFNFGVVLLFIGMSIIIFDYTDRLWNDAPLHLKLIIPLVLTGCSFRWARDGFWLFKDSKKMEYLRALERGMRFTI